MILRVKDYLLVSIIVEKTGQKFSTFIKLVNLKVEVKIYFR